MSLLLNCQSLSKSFGSKPLFEDLSFSVFSQDRLGLIGPNGCGKSTLLKILCCEEYSTAGTLSPKSGLKIGYVPQSSEFEDLSVMDVLLKTLEKDPQIPDYDRSRIAETWATKIGFTDFTKKTSELSGGWKKRLSFANVLMTEPDLLLLDEPTNHLDLEGVLWLEKFLIKESTTYILVSHDRYFLSNMTNRIIEINPIYPEGLFSTNGSYDTFLEAKEQFVLGQIEQEKSIATKVRRETEWLKKTPQARTTKSQSRIDQAHKFIQEHADIKKRNIIKKTQIDFESSDRQTRKLVTLKNISLEFGNKPLFDHLDMDLNPGVRLGVMGSNGSGKSSLLKLILGEVEPSQGTIKLAQDLNIVYFDQHRESFPLDHTVKEVLAPGGEFVVYRGSHIHVNGWCRRFLFSPDSLLMPIKNLSGGERARLSMARLMLKPADILLLDEPANDLDILTLQTLEETLLEFPGAIVLITHDRFMLKRLCNQFLSLDGKNTQYFAEYNQWEASHKATKKKTPKAKIASPSKPKLDTKKIKLIERQIAKEEKKLASLQEQMLGEEYARDLAKLNKIHLMVQALETDIEKLYLELMELG